MIFDSYFKRKKIVNLFLLLSIILICITIIFISTKRNNVVKDQKKIDSINGEGSTISLNNINHIATREGIKEWSLTAKAAHFFDEKKEALLEGLSIVFFTKDGKNVYLTAQKGILKTTSNDMEIIGNIVIQNDKYKLHAENLNYKHQDHIIISKDRVLLKGEVFSIEADSMSFDIETKKTLLNGNVKGVFSEIIS